jgi:hypothetical protein
MIPLAFKIAYTLAVAAIVAVYWRHYGPKNFLWFSDVALLGVVPALWWESALLASTLAALVLLLELFWNLGLALHLIAGRSVIRLTDYMFDARRPRWLRAMSLFHVALPLVLVGLVATLGYDARALPAAIGTCWTVLVATRLAQPVENVNWVRPPACWQAHPLRYFVGLALAIPLVAILPMHVLLLRAFG